ncbi:hypothetical protein ACFLUM_03435 [Chloroflexota bacterium]
MSNNVDRRIRVYVDGEPRGFFLGLRVRHAIGYDQARRVEKGDAMVEDGNGNRVDLDGALYNGEHLCVRTL